MDLDERVRRVERWIGLAPSGDGWREVNDAIRRALAAEEEGAIDEAASLRAQVADLTRERDEAEGALSVFHGDMRDARDQRDAAIARAEKAERERDEAREEAASYVCDRKIYDEQTKLIIDERDREARRADANLECAMQRYAQITARDAKIAEARKRISEIASWLRDNGHNWPWPEGHTSTCFCCVEVRKCDAWLAGNPTPAAKPVCDVSRLPEPDPSILADLAWERDQARGELSACEINLRAARSDIAKLEAESHSRLVWASQSLAERDAERAEVARLEGLVKRCEAWFEWFNSGRAETVENSCSLLRDLRAGRAAT